MTVIRQHHAPTWSMYHADCIDVVRALPDACADLVIYSPPFSNQYTYSSSERDMGNCDDDGEFFKHYGFLAGELLRVTKPGRLCAVHCKDRVVYKSMEGYTGLRDFPGALILAHEAAGWKFHSRCTIWKSPVQEMQRTKAQGLLYSQLRKDSTFSRMGVAEYVLYFKKWPKDAAEEAAMVPVTHTSEAFTLAQWQEWASPVWMTIDTMNVLQVDGSKGNDDERHICPLSLDVIERVVRLYSNPGEVVLSPFAGIGSEGVMALRCERKFLGVELKPEYYNVALDNLANSTRQLRLEL